MFRPVNHDNLIALIARLVSDIIRAFLNAGVMEGGLAASPARDIALPNAFFASLGLASLAVQRHA